MKSKNMGRRDNMRKKMICAFFLSLALCIPVYASESTEPGTEQFLENTDVQPVKEAETQEENAKPDATETEVNIVGDSAESRSTENTAGESLTGRGSETSDEADTEPITEAETNSSISGGRKWFRLSFQDILVQILGGIILIFLPGCYIYWRAKH